jgi:hypothetical protein
VAACGRVHGEAYGAGLDRRIGAQSCRKNRARRAAGNANDIEHLFSLSPPLLDADDLQGFESRYELPMRRPTTKTRAPPTTT